jgi:two-component system sensor histidine kinase BaeS
LDADSARIRSVIGNLLSNAIRHTPSGGSVTIIVNAATTEIHITVKDSGEGIPPDLLPHVLERFVKGPKSTGSGLGLAIAHDIIAAHGGKLEIESTPGAGTAVHVALPVRPS